MPRSEAEILIERLRDPRLAAHALGALPVWLWAADGSHMLWANVAGAAVFGRRNTSDLAARPFGPADQHRRQVARLAAQLPEGGVRLERLQGFGAALGRLRTCACSRFITTDGIAAVLVMAAEPAGRTLAFAERVRRLTDGIEGPAIAFDTAGQLIEANAAAKRLAPVERPDEIDLSLFGVDLVAAATQGEAHINAPGEFGTLDLFRLGQGNETALLALITPVAAMVEPPPEATVAPAEAAADQATSPPPQTTASTDASHPQPGHDALPELTPAAVTASLWAAFDRVMAAARSGEPAPAEASTEVAETGEIAPEATPEPISTVEPTQSPPDQQPVTADAETPEPAGADHVADIPVEAFAPPAMAPADAAPDTFAHDAPTPPACDTEAAPPDAVEIAAVDASGAPHAQDNAPDALTNPDAAAAIAPEAPPIPVADDTATEERAGADQTADDAAPAALAHVEREPVAEPAEAAIVEPPPAPAAPSAPHTDAAALALVHDASSGPRRHPLRFVWQMDAEGRFALGSDEFSRLIGPRTATAFGRPWSEIAALFGLDPEGRVAAAVATRNTWSGIVVNWPVDGPDVRLPVEMSGLPIYDRARQFLGYRGFGMCRDLDSLDRLAAERRRDALRPPTAAIADDQPAAPPENASGGLPLPGGPPSVSFPQPTDTHVDTPQNVVPFRLANEPKVEPRVEPKPPMLTPVENNAFNELARQLASRLEAERVELEKRDTAWPLTTEPEPPAPEAEEVAAMAAEAPAATVREEPPAWTTDHAVAPRAESRRDALLYDRIPVGILVYQLDRLLYANRAFLDRVGYPDLQALTAAGGLDALFVEPVAAGGSSASEEGAPVRIAATDGDDTPSDARLHSITWDGDAAHALIFAAPRGVAAPLAPPAPAAAVAPAAAPDADSAELRTVLDASDDAIFVVGRDGEIVSCNDGARRMFGPRDGDAFAGPLADLFAPASRDALRDAFDAVRHAGTTAAPRVHEFGGIARDGRALALRLTIGRTGAARCFAICRDLSEGRSDQDAARRKQAERTAGARADVLAQISQDLRTPLNAIVGFADVMIEERFGALGNERYAAYLRDIRASGERMLSTINDMVDLSRAETGQLHLSLTRQDLNDTVESCVAVLQPQANRERIIIRTALAQSLPPVTADTAALRQIVLNLIGNSIHVARAGGQIIVSTAVTDLGDIVLRVRDTGRGMNHSEMDAALEQFRAPSSEPLSQDNAGINMSLTRALVEANRAQFHIRSAPSSGTLIEVAFPPLAARTA